MNWEPLILTFKLAIVTTFLLLLLSIPLVFWLSITKSRLKSIVETLVTMPLVLPPTVLGFYLLLTFSPNSLIGSVLNDWFNIRLVFSFAGLVVASIIYSLPFMVNPIYSSLSSLPTTIRDAAYVMGKSKWETLLKIQLPLVKKSIITAIVLSFVHTVGEFGVVLMIGGNIPGKTKVVSIAIYDEVEALNYYSAGVYSLILFAFSFFILLFVNLINNGHLKGLIK